jgi:hypothetical protein
MGDGPTGKIDANNLDCHSPDGGGRACRCRLVAALRRRRSGGWRRRRFLDRPRTGQCANAGNGYLSRLVFRNQPGIDHFGRLQPDDEVHSRHAGRHFGTSRPGASRPTGTGSGCRGHAVRPVETSTRSGSTRAGAGACSRAHAADACSASTGRAGAAEALTAS